MNVGLRLIMPIEHMDRVIMVTYECGAQGIQWVEEEDGGPDPGTVWIHVWHDALTIQDTMEMYRHRLGPWLKIQIMNTEPGVFSADAPPEFTLTDTYHVRCVTTEDPDSNQASTQTGESQPILLEWGAGFGLGDHPTTRLCAEALQWVLAHMSRPKMADIGTGTGVLGIMAALGGATVWATDVEDIARRAASMNAARNGVSAQFTVSKTLPKDERFELIAANVYLGPIMAFSSELHHWIHPQGWGILSGFGHQEVDAVLSAYARSDWSWIRTFSSDDWVALVLRWQPKKSPIA